MEQSSGRDRLNIHGAVDLETGQTIMKDVLTVDALSTIMLLMAIEAMYPAMRWIHVFLDNARYHHAKLVQAWLAQPGRRIKLHFIPAYCPHLNPIERLWGLMHRHTTHNKCYSSFKDFSIAMLNFLRDDVPRNWRTYCDEVTDNFRVIDPREVPDYRVSGVIASPRRSRGTSRQSTPRRSRPGPATVWQSRRSAPALRRDAALARSDRGRFRVRAATWR